MRDAQSARVVRRSSLVGLLLLITCVTERAPIMPRSFRANPDPMAQLAPSEWRGAESARGPQPLEKSRSEQNHGDASAARGDGPAQEQPSPLHADVAQEPVSATRSPYHRFEWNLIHNADGSLTKLYYFRAQPLGPGANAYVDLLKRFIPGFASLAPEQDYWVKEKFLIDPRKESHDAWRAAPSPSTTINSGLILGEGQVADLVMITASEDMLRQIDAFLASVLADVPQIEIETTIVEVSLDDETLTGITMSFTKGNTTDPTGAFVRDISVKLAQNLVSGTFGTFKAIQDDLVVNGLIELLQSTTNSQILSAPKLAVLNGHRAIIDTGSETPYYTPAFGGTGLSTVTTQFKPTGISVVVTPFILTADMVQLEISVEVSAVTGFVTAAISPEASVENPLISRRNAHTVVNVPSGNTVLIGGLVTTDAIDEVDKVPFLGDIPLLGYLFKREHNTYQKAQVLFFVKPRIVEHRFREGEMYDPTEEFRTGNK